VKLRHAGLGLVPACTALLLVTNRGWPYPASVAVMLVGSRSSAASSSSSCAGSERRRDHPTVFTIGLAQVFVYSICSCRAGSVDVVAAFDFPTPYSHHRVQIGGVIFTVTTSRSSWRARPSAPDSQLPSLHREGIA